MANIPINPVVQKTPHAAVIIWNYDDRLGSEDDPSEDVNSVDQKIISTVSLMSISTTKSKGEPVGRFEINLAPTRNWVSEITSGSWMVILMSQNPITKDDFQNASPDKLKFFGKIESVRFNTQIIDPESGTRGSGYTMTGVDWCHIFENNIYIDPFIEPDNNTLGSTTYIGLFDTVINSNNRSSIVSVRDNILNLIKILGLPLKQGLLEQASVVNRTAQSAYSFAVPSEVQNYMGFEGSDNIVDNLELITGNLYGPNTYNRKLLEAFGWIDPASLRGINTMWQLIVDNSCPVLNETLTDLTWEPDGETPILALYNRIKPFTFNDPSATQERISTALETETFGAKGQPKAQQQQQANVVLAQVEQLISPFQFLQTFDIPLEEVITFDAGTNWRDKFNFAEIKPNFMKADALANWIKTVAQTADVKAFQREGFRPLIMVTKQFPTFGAQNTLDGQQNDWGININILAGWKQLLREWYFDTHRLLNGTMSIIGQNNYITVGSNIRIPMQILGRTQNFNQGALNTQNAYLLLHVEQVNQSFKVDSNGTRNWTTTISFVRGIAVTANGSLIGGIGKTDNSASDQTSDQYKNTNNVISTSSSVDPNAVKVNGT